MSQTRSVQSQKNKKQGCGDESHKKTNLYEIHKPIVDTSSIASLEQVIQIFFFFFLG